MLRDQFIAILVTTFALFSINTRGEDLRQKANLHVQDTHNKIELEKTKQQLEQRKALLNTTVPQHSQTSPSHSLGVNLNQENQALPLNDSSQTPSYSTDPHAQIQREISQDDQYKEYVEEYQDEFIKRYKKAASDAGVRVRVDRDFIVTGD